MAEYAGVPLAETQKDLTAFQRIVIQKEVKRQKEEQEKKQNNPHSGQTMNSHPQAGNSIKGETVEYVNENA